MKRYTTEKPVTARTIIWTLLAILGIIFAISGFSMMILNWLFIGAILLALPLAFRLLFFFLFTILPIILVIFCIPMITFGLALRD